MIEVILLYKRYSTYMYFVLIFALSQLLLIQPQ
jgi:hypothetical protein